METMDLVCSDACHEDSPAVVTVQYLEQDNEYSEQRYRQLTREKEESERRLERERRDRESLEDGYRLELEERLRCEEKFDEVSGAMAKYERELSLLRNENNHLKTQFSQLRSVVSGRDMAGAAVHVGVANASGSFTEHVVVTSGGTIGHEMYKEEVAILSHENELFKQIIEIIERQGQVQSEENRETHVLETSEQIMWLRTENSKLEERVREIEKSAREQEMLTEREREKAEEDVRKLKREVQILKSQLEKETQELGEHESQITEVKLKWEEEVQGMQMRLENEVSLKCQLQDQVHLLELNIRALEEERKSLLDKIELAYKKEDEVISERREFEDTYSEEINELELKLNQTIHEKMEASAEVERLTNELQDVKSQLVQMEEAYMMDLDEIRLRFEAEKEEFVRHFQQSSGGVLPDYGHAEGQVGTGEAQLHTGMNNWHMKLEQEVSKRQGLENENKQLLYQINKILSGDENVEKREEGKSVLARDRESSNKVQALEEELTELHEKCRVLERDARKKKEYENKTKELMEEIEGLMSKKEEMTRKQKELIRTAENSTSNVQEVETKNRRLEEQIDNLSRKFREMEDSHKQRGSATLSSEVNGLKCENENMKRTTAELQKKNEALESKVRDVEQQLCEVKAANERLEQEALRNEHRYNRDIDMERYKTESLRQELQKTSGNLKEQAQQFEKTLEDRKRLYEEHQRKLEDDKQRLKAELESEKESLRRRFEDEKQAIHQRVSQIESRLQAEGLSAQDTLWATDGAPGNVIQQGVGSQRVGSLSNHPASNLRHEVTGLRAANEDLERKLRDLERRSQREVEELTFKHQQETAKLRGEMEDSFRVKLEDVKRLDKEGDVRVNENEKRALNVAIQSLRREVCVVKQERERAILTLRNERRNFENRDSSNYENITKIKAEYEDKIRREEEKTNKATTELRRKIALADSKVAKIEAKHREELRSLEWKYEHQRTELEKMIQHTEERVKIRLQVEHDARLKEERTRYEETLKGLRREISALQEQRKQIQLKLKSTDVMTKSSSKELRYFKGMYGKLETRSAASLSEEKRKLEDRIKDLEQEVQLLKREKAEIKSSYGQEKLQIEAEFENERTRLEERYKKERDEFRRRLDASHVRVMVVNDGKESLTEQKMIMQQQQHQQNNSVLDSQSSALEIEIGSMKNRLEDLEARQRSRAASQQKDNQHRRLRFSSPERVISPRRTYFDDGGVSGSLSAFKRYHSSVDLRDLGHISDAYNGGSSVRSRRVDSSESPGGRKHSHSVNFPLHGAASGPGMETTSFLAGSLSDANFRSSGNLGASRSSLRKHASSVELSHAGLKSSLLNRASSPTKMNAASFPGKSSHYGFARGAGVLAGGASSMGYRSSSSGMPFQGNLSRSFNALALGGGVFPRNPVLFQDVRYLPSVGILGGSGGSFRGWAGGHIGSYSNRLSKVSLNPATSPGSSAVISGAGANDNGVAASAGFKTVVVSDAAKESSAENAEASPLGSAGQEITSSCAELSIHEATSGSTVEEQQQQQRASTEEVSAYQLGSHPENVACTSTE